MYHRELITPMVGATCMLFHITVLAMSASAATGGMSSPYSTAPPAGIMQVCVCVCVGVGVYISRTLARPPLSLDIFRPGRSLGQWS